MRRLTLELPLRQFKVRGLDKTLESVRSYTLLHRLKEDEKEYIAICRIELYNSDYNLADLVGQIGVTEIKPIHREKENVYVIEVSGRRASSLAYVFRSSGVYQIGTFEIEDEKLKLSFVGKANQISKFLSSMERQKICFKILSLVDARFSPDSPLSRLTDKQRRILLSAYNLGYYDIPRKVDTEELATKLNLVRSTVAEHLRKAELRIISGAISG